MARQVSQRLRLIKAFGGKHPLATSGLTCPPRVLPRLGSVQTPTQALREMQSRWTASIQADPTGRVRRRSDIPDSQPAWMSPSQGHRLHWSQRQQQQQEQHQQQQQQLQQLQPAQQFLAACKTGTSSARLDKLIPQASKHAERPEGWRGKQANSLDNGSKWHRLSLHSQSLLAHNLLWSSMGQCLMRSHC